MELKQEEDNAFLALTTSATDVKKVIFIEIRKQMSFGEICKILDFHLSFQIAEMIMNTTILES